MMNAKKTIVLFVLLTLLGSTAAEAFPLFGGSNYYNSGSNFGGRGHCNHNRHHKHRRYHQGLGW